MPTMQAARLYGKNDLRIEEIPQPQTGPGELLLRTGSASVCGTDIRMLKHGHAVTPLVMGHELAGT
ncbi:MAG: alcohol dehydrogenase catalytic domain-containing protein, partial [Verrucomicrobia bacterium]|nr:alcohol dehydrogenase catalytic domain-containing protein [Verrucomicrobiota bacterium]